MNFDQENNSMNNKDKTLPLQPNLDETSLLNLCKYYGGLTITIPTLDELETLVYALVLYESINIDGKLEEEAIKELKCDDSLKDDIIECYTSLIEILKDYKINGK